MKLLLLLSALSSSAAGQVTGSRVGDSWGTNIHWTSQNAAGEASMLSKAFKVARMDFNWGAVERVCGSYDFSAYDALLSVLQPLGVRSYWIIDYSNQACYPTPISQACDTAECIAAYGRLAAAAVGHFRGNGIIWETVNEPVSGSQRP
jgi:hypothetical protein